jgi:hypothetical protein
MTQMNGHQHKAFPLRITLAADVRLSDPCYSDDQIWELAVEDFDGGAVAFQTTLGLRAGHVRLYPRFITRQADVSNPRLFYEFPVLTEYLPNFASLEFQPIEGLKVTGEYWVPQSQGIAGRFTMKNLTGKVLTLRFEWVGELVPIAGGENFTPQAFGQNAVLNGKTGDFTVICCPSGISQSTQTPYPALVNDFQIVPGTNRTLKWSVAVDKVPEAAFSRTQQILSCQWDAEIDRIKMMNRSQMVEIITGKRSWDTAFAWSQNIARNLVMKDNTGNLKPVLARRPDHGYSLRGDGSDYSPLWSTCSALDAYFLTSFLLPGSVELCEGFLKSLLGKYRETERTSTAEDVPTSERLRSDFPILASLAVEIDRYKQDHAWLNEIFPLLMSYLRAWFSPQNDIDQDGFPEWTDPLQTTLPESPIFDQWNPESQGVKINFLESPGLAALLHRECSSMLTIAEHINQRQAIPWIKRHMAKLNKHIQESWDEKSTTYHYRDYQSHQCLPGNFVGEFSGSGEYSLQKRYKEPQRLMLIIETQAGHRLQNFQITIFGKKGKESVNEVISQNDIKLVQKTARYTSSQLYNSISKISIIGLDESIKCTIRSIDYRDEDISLLLPLFAQQMNYETAKEFIEKTIIDRYLGRYGLRVSPSGGSSTTLARPAKIHVNWNHLIIEGLLAYGYRQLAADIYSRIMDAIIIGFKKTGSFRELYHCENAEPSGEKNHLNGLPPRGLFLKILGIRIITAEKIILEGKNPFPWPITVKYKGTTITRHEIDTIINFHNGETVTLTGNKRQEIDLLKENVR